ncbi:multidrug efflux RND transporter permease subunit [Limibaculum sp. M0105]|uniref:Efflux pump membrane transporter n=1 Tax=Thermohalobaculum xanthum TaxID=2753746 RepID=A0A8J7M605_9RHOB|nr:multidrug efflux RND transporter permease subunit [Thermohalobaculum xanthum]MBK0398903.1 multidrug efflux RND transporter permease subunit [Thermohalobaculum xanthum]
MRFSHFFIDRPIFATVLSVVAVLMGLVSYTTLPVAQYPDIAPPTIQVRASFPGASAETVADTVASVIEQEVNGVEGMLYMLSQSTGDGNMSLSITFALGTDIDTAQVLVQNRVAAAEARLPEEVRRLGVTTEKSSPDLMMVIHMLSPDGSRDQLYISNYARTQVVDQLARIEGVGRATVFAERAYSMRVWLDPDLVAARGLTAGDVVQALRANNVQVASGIVNRQPLPKQSAWELQVTTEGRLKRPEQFEDVVVATTPEGGLVRVRDIGRVELGAQDYAINGYLDRDVALPIGVFQRPGSNALETSEAVLAMMEELSKSFPEGIEYTVVYNPTEFIQASIDAVITTLLEAVVLVTLVIVVFLQSLRTAIIPIVAIPVSLIGTFVAMQAFGFSLNTLSLFGLVLAIGIVVDDAIIVVENVERYLEEGFSPREAAHKTMDEVGTALIASVLVMIAVFAPVAAISGISGQFFRQFALTISAAVALSGMVSLTLSPALAALLMRPKHRAGPAGPLARLWDLLTWPFRQAGAAFNWGFERIAGGYAWLVRRLLRIIVMMLVVYGGLIYLAVDRFQAAPTGFIPPQDQGYLITVVQLPAGAALSRTDAVARKVSGIALEHPGVAHAVPIVGLDGATFTNAPNAAAIFLTLKPFEWRAEEGYSAERIQGELMGQLFPIAEANIFIVQPPPVRGVGSTGGWKMYVQDRRGRGLEALEEAVFGMMIQGNQTPGLQGVFSLFNTRTPRIFADIDRVKAELIGVSPEAVNETLEIYLGSAFVNDFNFLGQTYRVTAQADGPFRDDPSDIADLRTRSAAGEMTPIGAVATLSETTGPWRVARYNLFPAAAVQGGAAPGVSTGDALALAEGLAAQVLPSGFEFEWTEMSLQEKLASGSITVIFVLAVVFVFLALAAQYESWLLPLAVILIVPMCLLAAITGVLYRGMDNNILTQIGLVVLVGLAAKNAILIVEFARQAEEDRGLSRVEAAIEAARLRLRPILMTSFAFILGVVPLVIATGAGAEMRQALGTAVFSGMLGVTAFGLIFTPLFYVLCRWIGVVARRARGMEKAGQEG